MPAGKGNLYRARVAGPFEEDTGPKLRRFLVQRNDNIFSSLNERDEEDYQPGKQGKTIIAWHERESALLVGVVKDHNPNGAPETLVRLTHLLKAASFNEAVFCDGSDSAMLWYKGVMVIAPGKWKANAMNTGLGFKAIGAAAPGHGRK
jgi:hypothetical protein